MNNIINLYKGELKRLVKYKILIISLCISIFMGLLIYSTATKEEAISVYSSLLFSDVVLLGMMITMSGLFLERQENTLKSLLVSPVKIVEIIISKILANITLGLQTLIIISIALFIKVEAFDISLVAFEILIPAIVVAIIFHTAIGFIFNYISIDFSNSLLVYSAYAIIFSIPSLLVGFIDVPDFVHNLLLLSPSHSSNVLFKSALYGEEVLKVVFCFIYQLILGLLLLKFIVIKNFKDYVSRGD